MLKDKITTIIMVVLILTLVLVGCSKETGTNTSDDGKIVVYTSFYAMYDFASKIGGDKVSITNRHRTS